MNACSLCKRACIIYASVSMRVCVCVRACLDTVLSINRDVLAFNTKAQIYLGIITM